MNPRRPRPAARPKPDTPETLSLRSSTANWFAEWKARKTAAPAAEPAAEPPAPHADEAAEALARWLTGDGK